MKDKPLIHTVEENKDKPHYHNVSGEKLFDGSRIIDLLFVMKQLKDGCTVCGEFQNIAHPQTENIIGLHLKGQLQRFHKLSLFDRFRHVENGLDINF